MSQVEEPNDPNHISATGNSWASAKVGITLPHSRAFRFATRTNSVGTSKDDDGNPLHLEIPTNHSLEDRTPKQTLSTPIIAKKKKIENPWIDHSELGEFGTAEESPLGTNDNSFEESLTTPKTPGKVTQCEADQNGAISEKTETEKIANLEDKVGEKQEIPASEEKQETNKEENSEKSQTNVTLPEQQENNETIVQENLEEKKEEKKSEENLDAENLEEQPDLSKEEKKSEENHKENENEIAEVKEGEEMVRAAAETKEKKDAPEKQENQENGEEKGTEEDKKEELKEKRRREILEELIETERNYLSDLEVIINVFYIPLQEKSLLAKEQMYKLFSNIQDIYNTVNVNFLKELEDLKNEKSTESVGSILCKFANLFKLYAAYCSNQPIVRDSIETFKQENEEFASFLKKAQKRKECRKLDLTSFLMTPLQRLCKYPLLLKELLKYTAEGHPEYQELNLAIENFVAIVNQVNERVRRAENVAKLFSIVKIVSFTTVHFDLLTDHKRVCRLDGELVVNSKVNFVYLFNDLLLFTRELNPPLDGKKYEAVQAIPLATCKLNDESISLEDEFHFELIVDEKEVLRIESTSKLRIKTWLKNLKEAIKEAGKLRDDTFDVKAAKKPTKRDSKGSHINSPLKKTPSSRILLDKVRNKSLGPSVRKIAEQFENPSKKSGGSHLKKTNSEFPSGSDNAPDLTQFASAAHSYSAPLPSFAPTLLEYNQLKEQLDSEKEIKRQLKIHLLELKSSTDNQIQDLTEKVQKMTLEIEQLKLLIKTQELPVNLQVQFLFELVDKLTEDNNALRLQLNCANSSSDS